MPNAKRPKSPVKPATPATANGVVLGPESPLQSRALRERVLGQYTLSESGLVRRALELLIGKPMLAKGVPNPGYRAGDGWTARFPEIADLYAIPNQRHSKGEAARMKAEGTLAAMFDYGLDAAHGPFHGLRLEAKTEAYHSRPRADQRALHVRWEARGYCVLVPTTVEAFVAGVVGYCAMPTFDECLEGYFPPSHRTRYGPRLEEARREWRARLVAGCREPDRVLARARGR